MAYHDVSKVELSVVELSRKCLPEQEHGVDAVEPGVDEGHAE